MTQNQTTTRRRMTEAERRTLHRTRARAKARQAATIAAAAVGIYGAFAAVVLTAEAAINILF